jgi:hypothetical protein
MNHHKPCTQWAELLAMSHPEVELSSVEYQALKEHVAQCKHCTATQLRFSFITAQIRTLPQAKALPDFIPGLLELKEDGAAIQKERRERKLPARASWSRGNQQGSHKASFDARTTIGSLCALMALLLFAFLLFCTSPLLAEVVRTIVVGGKTISGRILSILLYLLVSSTFCIILVFSLIINAFLQKRRSRHGRLSSQLRARKHFVDLSGIFSFSRAVGVLTLFALVLIAPIPCAIPAVTSTLMSMGGKRTEAPVSQIFNSPNELTNQKDQSTGNILFYKDQTYKIFVFCRYTAMCDSSDKK